MNYVLRVCIVQLSPLLVIFQVRMMEATWLADVVYHSLNEVATIGYEEHVYIS